MKHTGRRRFRLATIISLSLGIALLLLWLSRDLWLAWPAKRLVHDDHPLRGADAIILLMGSLPDRAHQATQLYRDGYGRKVIFARCEDSPMAAIGLMENESVYARRYLLDHGVREDDLVYIVDSVNRSTVDEARGIINFLKSRTEGPQRIIIVTSWYHSSRAAWIFRRLAPERLHFEMVPAPPLHGSIERWWEEESTFLEVFNEYLKWVYYLTKYS